MTREAKNPWVAVFLSIIPGMGQVYAGKAQKGIALLCITGGLALAALWSHSRLVHILMLSMYFAVLGPTAIEAYRLTKYGMATSGLDTKTFVVWMLITTGFSALPLLWQSNKFSRTEKTLWTLVVPILAICFFWALTVWGSKIESMLQKI